MAKEVPILMRSKVSTNDLSALQFTAVVLDTTAGNVIPPGAGVAVYGVVQNNPVAGAVADVMVYGLTKMIVGASTVTVADKVMVDSAGKAVTATSTNFSIGWAEETGAAGTTISVMLIPSGKV